MTLLDNERKKKMKKHIVLLLMLILPILICTAALADNDPVWHQCGYYRYILLEDGTVQIDGYCGAEESIDIPAELDGRKVTAIGDDAFAIFDRYELTAESGPIHVTLPEGITHIGSRSFCGCAKMESVSIPDSVVFIGDCAFLDCYSLTEIAIPDGLTHLGANPFGVIPPEVIRLSPNHSCYEIREGMLFDKRDDSLICGPAMIDTGNLVIPDGTKRIGDYAFIYRRGITSVVFPDSLREIGNYAFLECYSLNSLSLPEGLLSIGDHAFEGCVFRDGPEITIPDSVTWLGDDPFYICNVSIQISANHPYLEIVDGMLCSKPDHRLIRRIDRTPEKATIPDGTEMIGGTVFAGIVPPKGLANLEGVTSIGDRAFDGYDPEMAAYCSYPASTDLRLPESLQSIGYRAFRGFPFRTDTNDGYDLQIPSGVKDIGEEAFSMASFTKLTIPGSVSVISRSAFRQCRMTEAILSEGVTYIGDNAFCESGLMHVTLPESLRFIGNKAFFSSGLTEISLPEGLQYIGSEAFGYCPLTVLTIPDSVTAVSPFAFRNCGAEIRVSSDQPCLKVVDGALIEKETGRVLHVYTDDKNEYTFPQETRIIGGYVFDITKTIGSVIVPDGVSEIDAYAFSLRRTSSVYISGSVKVIGSNVFWGSLISTVILDEGIEEISDYAFYSARINDLHIPDSVSRIGEHAFEGCRKLSLTVSPGSYAEQYCIDHGLDYVNP